MSEPGAKSAGAHRLSFEAAFAELEAVVQQLEEGELSLEESIALYERGQMLARLCQEHLDQAELRVDQLDAVDHAGDDETDGLLC
jgi:exodeoxyribonuclease VII small subunit